LQQQHQNEPLIFPLKTLGQHQLICYQPDLQTNWKIAIPTSMLHPIINWYHKMLSHICNTHLYQTINTHFAHPDLWLSVEQTVKQFDTCQRYKLLGHGYGELPPQEALLMPWMEVAVDTIGPWKIEVQGHALEFHALTCIDTVTNLTELI
jgi:hypothetical protein